MTAQRSQVLDRAGDIIVVGLGFGDEGKGATVDCAVRGQGGVAPVVRFNGGAQAAHNVVADGRAPHVRAVRVRNPAPVCRPTWPDHAGRADRAGRRGRELDARGSDPLSPAHRGPRRAAHHPDSRRREPDREDARGAARHGSCGLGIGETTWYDLAWQARARAGDVVQNLRSPGAAGDRACGCAIAGTRPRYGANSMRWQRSIDHCWRWAGTRPRSTQWSRCTGSSPLPFGSPVTNTWTG